ncbi:hypothetical protein [Oxynema aestuarii]|uniref:hypothetical protein n=1 Tax=Oxynema aestuarii TaxID=2874213 RepID=UPI000F0FAFC9|nr:hypothetical protein [Oxynema aestuarii]RMH74444.1 MAG: hypothetical protein D6680_14690 [Cyanobacteria bacterium J007]
MQSDRATGIEADEDEGCDVCEAIRQYIQNQKAKSKSSRSFEVLGAFPRLPIVTCTSIGSHGSGFSLR